ncbi:3 beta-hydroxysteroid dehydrogenase type 7 [Cladochytrium tenue]|nr:3 beta-hydroxysteroid dehydrogenase type 7 [Cladochytrium tenue]
MTEITASAVVIVGAAAVAVAVLRARAARFARDNALTFLPPPDPTLLQRRLASIAAAAGDSATPTATDVDGAARRYLVVGAGGNLGREVVHELRRRWPAATVVAFDIRLPQDDLLFDGSDPRVRPVVGDIRDPIAVADAVAGCTHVVNVAGLLPIDLFVHKLMREVNIVGGKNVLEAAIACPTVKAFVYTTSLSADLGWNRHSTLDPPVPLERIDHYFPYSRSKAIVQKLVIESNSPTFPTAAISPAGVMTESNIDLLMSAPIWMMGKKLDWIGVKDLARAHVLLVDALSDPTCRPRCAGKVFRCSKVKGPSDDQDAWRVFSKHLAGKPIPPIPWLVTLLLPPFVDLAHAWILGPVTSFVLAFTSAYVNWRKSTVMVGELDEGWEEFGFRPEMSLEDIALEYRDKKAAAAVARKE